MERKEGGREEKEGESECEQWVQLTLGTEEH